MKNLLGMYIFRAGVISWLSGYIWINIENTILKWLILMIGALMISYYWNDLKPLIHPIWLWGIMMTVTFLLAIFIFKPSTTQEIACKTNDHQNYQLRIIRDTILQNDINVTLGKVQNGCLAGQLVLIRSGIDDSFNIDDVIQTAVTPKANDNMTNPFDMMFFGRVNYQLNFVDINKVYQTNHWSLFKIIATIRNTIDQNIKLSVGLKNYNLISMWLLGKSKINDQELNSLFKNLGISHILVISGTHLSILFNIVGWMLIMIVPGYGWYLILLVIFLIFFLLLTGFSSSIFRATLFWLFLIIGRFNGKIVNYTNVLLMILLVFFMINPLTIIYDIGFHLSFLSMIALVYELPIISYFIKQPHKKWNWLLDIFNATMAITILLLPYLVYRFSEFNILSIIFNIFLIPLSGLILGAAFITAIVSFLGGWIAQFFGWIVYWLINIFLLILNWLENISINVHLAIFNSIFLVIIYYGVLTIMTIDFYKKHKVLTLNI